MKIEKYKYISYIYMPRYHLMDKQWPSNLAVAVGEWLKGGQATWPWPNGKCLAVADIEQ